MITYNDFINKMLERGYFKNDCPIIIDNKNQIVNIYSANKSDTTKIIELCCPENKIIALCGLSHVGGCNEEYLCNIKCYDDNHNEPFQELHYSTVLSKNDHVVAEIIVTKILQKEPPKDNQKVKEWSERISSILKVIKSENALEHVMWAGAYSLFNSEFIKSSFTLYGNQKMIFYINNPDIDITKVDFEMKVDVFEKQKL